MADMTTPRNWLTLPGGNRVMLFLACAIALAAAMLPVSWSVNEINYFDLAHRFARPDLYGPDHAVFDSSKGRVLSFWILGSVIDVAGFETAKTIFAILNILLYALALTGLAAILGLGPAAMVIALAIYFAQQSLLGGEWVFQSVEAKTFAYPCVLAGIAAGISGRWVTAIVLAALGTAFHFLVGGFWGVALLAFHALSIRDWKATLRLLALFAVLVSPLVTLLAFERLGAEIDLTGLDLSLAKIYAVYRGSHHIAPFAYGIHTFAFSWFPGAVVHAGLALACLMMHRDFGSLSRFALWVAGLNAYIVAALALAFLDRDTHLLAPLYIFRPAAIILFLSVLLIIRRVLFAIEPGFLHRLSLPAATISAAFLLPEIALNTARLTLGNPNSQRLETSIKDEQHGVLDWLQANTTPADVVLVEPDVGDGSLAEGLAFPAGLERLTPAAYYVNFKFVPTAPADMAEWYRRLKDRRAIFDGDCALFSTLPPNLLVIRHTSVNEALNGCTEVVYSNDVYLILRLMEN